MKESGFDRIYLEHWSRKLPDRSEPRLGVSVEFNNQKFSETNLDELDVSGTRPLIAGMAEKQRYAHYSSLFPRSQERQQLGA